MQHGLGGSVMHNCWGRTDPLCWDPHARPSSRTFLDSRADLVSIKKTQRPTQEGMLVKNVQITCSKKKGAHCRAIGKKTHLFFCSPCMKSAASGTSRKCASWFNRADGGSNLPLPHLKAGPK